jgi:hypothetical protein
MANDGLMQYFAKFGLDARDFLNEIAKADNSVLKFYRDVSVSMYATMMIFDRVMQYGQQFIALADQASEFVSTIDKLSITTGMSVDELQRMSNVARYADSDISSLAVMINRLQLNLNDQGESGERARKILDSMGVSYKNANGTMRSATEIFPEMIGGLKGLSSSADRVTAANALVGRGYQELAGYIDLGKDGIVKYYTTANTLTDEQTQKLRDYETAMKDLNTSTDHLAKTAGGELASSFSSFAGLMDHLAENQGVIVFFTDLNLLLEMTAEGFAVMGGGAAAAYGLLDQTGSEFMKFDKFAAKLAQTTHDVAVMRDRFANPENYLIPEEGIATGGLPSAATASTTAVSGSTTSTTDIVKNAISLLNEQKLTIDDIKNAWDAGRISVQQYNEILIGAMKTTEATADAQKNFVDAAQKLSDINRDYMKDVASTSYRDPAKLSNLISSHQSAVEDQERVIGKAAKDAGVSMSFDGATIIVHGDGSFEKKIAEINRANGVGRI